MRLEISASASECGNGALIEQANQLLEEADRHCMDAIQSDRTFYIAYDNRGNIAINGTTMAINAPMDLAVPVMYKDGGSGDRPVFGAVIAVAVLALKRPTTVVTPGQTVVVHLHLNAIDLKDPDAVRGLVFMLDGKEITKAEWDKAVKQIDQEKAKHAGTKGAHKAPTDK